MAGSWLLELIGSYPILSSLARQISTIDLFHLALTCKTAHSYILQSPKIFKVLTRQSLCDGRGLYQRQNFLGLYDHREYRYSGDRPVEVRLWALKCDAANALPCLKCGVNICEECRYMDREGLLSGRLSRWPFPEHRSAQHENYMAFCPSCDDQVEEKVVNERWGSLICDCDLYTRWICTKCHTYEKERERHYSDTCTKGEWEDGAYDLELETKTMQDHQHLRWASLSFIPPRTSTMELTNACRYGVCVARTSLRKHQRGVRGANAGMDRKAKDGPGGGPIRKARSVSPHP